MLTKFQCCLTKDRHWSVDLLERCFLWGKSGSCFLGQIWEFFSGVTQWREEESKLTTKFGLISLLWGIYRNSLFVEGLHDTKVKFWKTCLVNLKEGFWKIWYRCKFMILYEINLKFQKTSKFWQERESVWLFFNFQFIKREIRQKTNLENSSAHCAPRPIVPRWFWRGLSCRLLCDHLYLKANVYYISIEFKFVS